MYTHKLDSVENNGPFWKKHKLLKLNEDETDTQNNNPITIK